MGLWEEKLKSSMLVTGGRVIYPKENDFPRLDPLGDIIKNMFQQSHAKSSEWNYEKEYRLAKLFYPETPTTNDRIEEIPDSFFAEIIIGINASSETRNEIAQIARSKNIKIYQAVKLPFKFEIDRIEL